ncbi:MAG: LytTR family DNA-binding domain-containing protein [Saprospiraceae bacterium]|nr:response regulator transcription factor [Saprospiraceae bacterium]MCB9311403.1 response regulator transcription factor [Lewinellaceae bacterium]
MQPIRTLIIDDEPLAREILESHAAQIPELEVLASCGNALEANEIVQSTEVDLLFLDIQMPQISGLDWLRSLRTPPLVIFTTAFSEYAVEGFELNAIDYLLKPIAFDRFLKAVNKAKEQLRSRKPEAGSDQYMFVKADKKLVKVSFEDIVYIEGLKDYVIIRLEQDRVITLQTMKSLEEKLPTALFKRIHRSYIVNVQKIQALDGSMIEVNLKNQTKLLPIGKNYRDEVLEIIQQNRI